MANIVEFLLWYNGFKYCEEAVIARLESQLQHESHKSLNYRLCQLHCAVHEWWYLDDQEALFITTPMLLGQEDDESHCLYVLTECGTKLACLDLSVLPPSLSPGCNESR